MRERRVGRSIPLQSTRDCELPATDVGGITMRLERLGVALTLALLVALPGCTDASQVRHRANT